MPKNRKMNTDESYENLAVVIVLSSCGAAILLAAIILICCHLFIKPKNNSHYYNSRRNYTLERQTTTSDDNNGEMYSCCVEESVSASHDVDSDEEKTSSPQAQIETVLCDQFECTTGNNVTGNDTLANNGGRHIGRSTSHSNIDAATAITEKQIVGNVTQIRSSCDETIDCKSKYIIEELGVGSNKIKSYLQPRETNHHPRGQLLQSQSQTSSGSENESIRKSSSGITRQQSFDDPDAESSDLKIKSNSAPTQSSKEERKSDSEKSPETARREYRELWQLRTTLENEEVDSEDADEEDKTDSPDSEKTVMTPKLSDHQLTKYDSGYKSIERRDYSIDSKTESIYRQFISNSAPSSRKSHQSIQEEQETEAFV